MLINVARGGIVDEAALLHGAAVRRPVRRRCWTSSTTEPLAPDSPWWSEPRAFVTPHVSGLAPGYFDQVLDLVSENLRRFLAGVPLLNRVDRDAGY